MQQVNPSFNIQASEIDFEKAQLFTEVGPMGVSLIVLGADNCFNAVVTYTFVTQLNENELAEKAKEIFSSENLLQKNIIKRIFSGPLPKVF